MTKPANPAPSSNDQRPATSKVSLRAERFGLVRETVECPLCSAPAPVGLLCVELWQFRAGGSGAWQERTTFAWLTSIEDVSVPARYVWQRTCPWVQRSTPGGGGTLRNRCTRCARFLEDRAVVASLIALNSGVAPGPTWYDGSINIARCIPLSRAGS